MAELKPENKDPVFELCRKYPYYSVGEIRFFIENLGKYKMSKE